MDIWTVQKRSQVMSAVRSKGNQTTEVNLARALRRHHVTGWRRHHPIAIGSVKVRPDFVFLSMKVAVFVDGCFWHGCPVHGTKPASRRWFWHLKLVANQRRDRRISCALRRRGWKVIRMWEHSVAKDIDGCITRIKRALSC
jgi:DNA mismatch endonuclease (patch repair protein)